MKRPDSPITDNDLLKALDFRPTCMISTCEGRMTEQFVLACTKCKCVDATTLTCASCGAALFDQAQKNPPPCHCGASVQSFRNLLR